MHGAETGGGVWDARLNATRSVRTMRVEEVVPESVSSEKPRALKEGMKDNPTPPNDQNKNNETKG